MKNIIEFASHLFIFDTLSHTQIGELLKTISYEIRTFSRREVIYSPDEFEKKIGFVVSGCCEICRKKHDSSYVALNVIKKHEAFGVLAAFSEEAQFPTVVYSTKETEILFLSKSDVLMLMEKSHVVSLNIIKFLTKKVEFLNSKIATFTYTKVEDKLASFILSEYEKSGNTDITFNCQKAAAVINVGRASIYRALDHLCKCGCITYDTKKISIKNTAELERTLK